MFNERRIDFFYIFCIANVTYDRLPHTDVDVNANVLNKKKTIATRGSSFDKFCNGKNVWSAFNAFHFFFQFIMISLCSLSSRILLQVHFPHKPFSFFSFFYESARIFFVSKFIRFLFWTHTLNRTHCIAIHLFQFAYAGFICSVQILIATLTEKKRTSISMRTNKNKQCRQTMKWEWFICVKCKEQMDFVRIYR